MRQLKIQKSITNRSSEALDKYLVEIGRAPLISIDEEKNSKRSSGIMDITGKDSKVKVLVVPTNEELMIASDTLAIVSK